ncbi:MAG: carbonic anhydrase [Woeseiaceae bacterium]|nr:carbonic anhydrase [Woeseiaceae bacterium]
MLTAAEALRRLADGNRRFVAGESLNPGAAACPADTAAGQRPFAVILGCSDSRVPAEIVFDQGLGDLFVIRIAGNIVAPSQIGSVEFAVTSYGTPLVMVLGHSGCGAVLATVDQLQGPAEARSRNLATIVNFVRPSVRAARAACPDADHDALVARAVRENIRRSVEHLRHGSDIIEDLVSGGQLEIVGAEYSLETGEVELLGDKE